MEPQPVDIGPFTFLYIPDGDDPDTGWMRVSVSPFRGICQVQSSRFEWDQFLEELKSTGWR